MHQPTKTSVLAEGCSKSTHGSPAESSRPVSRPIHRGPSLPTCPTPPRMSRTSWACTPAPPSSAPRTSARTPAEDHGPSSRPARRHKRAPAGHSPPPCRQGLGPHRCRGLAPHTACTPRCGRSWGRSNCGKGGRGSSVKTQVRGARGTSLEILEAKTSFLELPPALSWSEPRASSGRCQFEGGTPPSHSALLLATSNNFQQ